MKRPFELIVPALLGLLASTARSAETPDTAWTVAGELTRKGPEDLSGLCRKTNDLYWTVGDSSKLLHLVRIPLDCGTGAPEDFVIVDAYRVTGADDLEGVASDPLSDRVWICDEAGPSLHEYDPAARKTVSRLTTDGNGPAGVIPAVFASIRDNSGFEALAISPDGLSLWTCNEDALTSDRIKGKGKDKGRKDFGDPVRLQRFTRTGADAPWKADGQWAVRLGRRPKANAGASELCVLPDGRLVLLEREKFKHKGEAKTFGFSLYELDVSKATDVSAVPSLVDQDFTPVGKKLVFATQTGRAMYEGLAVGPRLADGSPTLVLVSDGEKGAESKILVLRAK